MTHKIYDKLVRDNIPDILEANNLKFKVEYLSDADAMKYTVRKLSEEVAELIEQIVLKSRDGICSELADIISVIMKIGIDWDIDIDEVLQAEEDKSEVNGFFFDNCVLKWVDEPAAALKPKPKKTKAAQKPKKSDEDEKV
jgi:predicted house-cleaning noncanonical NTP pyrophosphatase (MazG superfamily)